MSVTLLKAKEAGALLGLSAAENAEVDAEIARSGDMERRFLARLNRPSGYDLHAAKRKAANTASRNAISGKRRAAKMKRTPAWADLKAIKAIYVQAQALTTSTGVEHHVDHVYPLQGRLVSGLHLENNLQILPGSENCRKSNRFPTKPSA